MGFWSDFSGNSARDDTARGTAKGLEELKGGYRNARIRSNQAYGEYAPYAAVGQQGMADNTVYRQAIGLGTPQEQSAAQDRYFNDPALQRMMEPQFNAMTRYQNARGSVGGGKAALAGARIANENYGGWLDRVNNSGQNAMATGFNAANARAGIRQGQGDLAYGYGATRAGARINQGNAMAESRGVLSNNLLGLAGTAAKAYAGMGGMGGGGGDVGLGSWSPTVKRG